MDVSGFLKTRSASQPSLFASPPDGKAKRLLARLLEQANSHARSFPEGVKVDFYAMKDALLARFATPDGHDWQDVSRPCWGCMDCDDHSYRHGNCGGSGVYMPRFVKLKRWKIAGRTFHTVVETTTAKPATPVRFKGLVPHRIVAEKDAWHALLTLAVIARRYEFAARVVGLLTRSDEAPF